MSPRLFFAAVLVLGLSASLQAQQFPNNQNMRRIQPNNRQPIVLPAEIEGIIEGVTHGGIMILDSNNQPCQVLVPPTAKVHVTGTATADYLQSGLTVEFKGEVDDKGALKEKVSELSIVTLSAEKKPGLFPADDAGGEEGAAAGAKTDRGTKTGKTAKRPAGKGVAAGNYRIVGRLTIAHGKTTVQAGRSVLQLELSDQPTISVDLSDGSIAAKGDKVSVKGVKAQSRTGVVVVQASEVKIELAEPLAGVKKRTPAKAEAKHPAKRSKKDDAASEPAAE